MGRQTLFCPGIPGAGKTILASVVIDDLNIRFRKDSSVGVVYIYYDYRLRDEQKIASDRSIYLLSRRTVAWSISSHTPSFVT